LKCYTITAPATFTKGKHPIGFILGTKAIKRATIANGYLPLYAGARDSDHRALFIDINIYTLLGGVPELDKTPKRILQSSNKLMARKFLITLGKNKNLQTMHDKISEKKHKRVLTKKDKQTLETIDQQFTQTLLQAEKKCKLTHNQPWSEVLHQRNPTHLYWKMYQKGRNNKVNIQEQLQDIIKEMKDPNQHLQGDKIRPPKNNFEGPRKLLKQSGIQFGTIEDNSQWRKKQSVRVYDAK
jgi:hypothetical protein